MKHRVRQLFVFSIFIVVAIALQSWLQNNLFSFFIIPIGLSTLLPYTYPSSLLPVSFLILFSELLTTYPLGIMTLIIITPFVMRKIFKNIPVDVSGSFYFLIASTTLVQLIILQSSSAIILSQDIGFSFSQLWQYTPFKPILISLLISSLVVYLWAILWQELLLNNPPINLNKS